MNIGRIKTKEFLNILSARVLEKHVKAKEIESIVRDSKELIEYNEWLVALEIAIDNLYEIDFEFDETLLAIAEEALRCSEKGNKYQEILTKIKSK